MANTNAKRRKKQGKQRRKVSMLKARDETRKMSAAAAEANASTARAATDLMRGQFETVQRAWEVAAEAARDVAARPIDQLSRASGLVGKNGNVGMQQSLRNVETVMESGTVIASAIHNSPGTYEQPLAAEYEYYGRARKVSLARRIRTNPE